MKNILYFILGFVFVATLGLMTESYGEVYTYSDSPCKIVLAGEWGEPGSYGHWYIIPSVSISESGIVTADAKVVDYGEQIAMVVVTAFWNGTEYQHHSNDGGIAFYETYRASLPDGVIDYNANAEQWNTSLEQTCVPPEPCEDELQDAIDECDGDPEAVQVFNLEEGNCDIRCTPCVLDDDVRIWEDPEQWIGISLEDAIEKCGESGVTYDVSECSSECQEETCEGAYASLANECGGTQWIASWSETECNGTCVPCSNEINSANNECGENLYTMDEECNYSCNTCDEKLDECIAVCGSLEEILDFTCDDSENYFSACICKDDSIIPTIPPELENPTSIDKSVTYEYHGDGTATETETVTETDEETGEQVIEKTITTIASDGTRTQISKQWSVGNVEDSENPLPDNDEGSEEEEDIEYEAKERSINFTPLLNSGEGITDKFPVSLVSGAIAIFDDFDGVGSCPSFEINIHGHILEFDMCFFNPIAALLKGLFSMVIVVGGAFAIVKQWM